MSHTIRVGVLRGGPSDEYEVSLNTGAEILAGLKRHYEDTYTPRDILIDRSGNWHFDGQPISRNDIPRQIDVAFNALHGSYGEDGKVQHILESHRLPFTGSGSLASAVGMNKVLAKRVFQDHGILTPFAKEIRSQDINDHVVGVQRELFQTFMLPAVVKPTSSGSSVGVTIVTDYRQLPEALLNAAKYSDSVMIEEFIKGVEATCGVVENFRGQELYALPVIEIRPHPEAGFFSYDAKYAGKSHEIVPASFTNKVKARIEELSCAIHRALGLRHYSRMDFIIHPKRGIFVLEANTLPGLTSESLIPKALRAIGSDTHEFADHVIRLALNIRE